MAIITRILEDDVVVHVGSGSVDVQQALEAVAAWHDHELFRRDMPVVWDFYAADLIISWRDISRLHRSVLDRFPNARQLGRTAFVLTEDIGRVVIESVYDASDWSTEWQIFEDTDAAIQWVTNGRARASASAWESP